MTASFPNVGPGDIPWLTTEQMIEVDRAMIEDYRIELIQMMENAGRNLATVARARFLGGAPAGRRVTVLAGTGGNGGGAMVAARRLASWGARVELHVTDADAMTPIPAHQLDIVRRMGVAVARMETLGSRQADVVLDGIIGYSLSGDPRGAAKEGIDWANAQSAPVLSLDAPSGIDTTTGDVRSPAIRATATMTLALPKEGLRKPGVAEQVGELYLADISVPPHLYRGPGLGLTVGPIFERGDIVRLA